MNRLSSTVYHWLDARLGLDEIKSIVLDEPIPGGARWSTVFGSALLFLFFVQAFTGILLTMYYVPTADAAHTSVSYIQKEITRGSFVRGVHHWGSTMLIVVLGVLVAQVFL
jgi:ubiquinol-cytochrome c reductase cytochrome b subunit